MCVYCSIVVVLCTCSNLCVTRCVGRDCNVFELCCKLSELLRCVCCVICVCSCFVRCVVMRFVHVLHAAVLRGHVVFRTSVDPMYHSERKNEQ